MFIACGCSSISGLWARESCPMATEDYIMALAFEKRKSFIAKSTTKEKEGRVSQICLLHSEIRTTI